MMFMAVGKFREICRRSGLYLTAAALIFSGCERSSREQAVIARVGDEKLTLDELLDEVPPPMRVRISREDLQEFITRWINTHILYQEAKRRGLDTQIDVRRELRRLEVDLVANALLDQVLDKPIEVSEEEIQRYYQMNRSSFVRTSPEIRALHVRCANAASADSLYSRFLGGEDFGETARRLAPDRADQSSWDSYISEEETTPEIADHIFRMPTGTISTPIQSDFGYHIFKIMDRFPRQTVRDLEQVRTQILGKLEMEIRQARYRQLLSDLKSNTVVETDLSVLDNVSLDSLFAARGSTAAQQR